MKFWLYFASIVFLAACGSDPAQLTADQQGSASLHSNAFKITTFNIKWYGLKTDNPDAPVGDFRDSYLLRFVEENFSDNDAIMFTEVVNKTHLMELMAHKMNCVSYEGRGRMHQHVVLCYDKFKYRVGAYDDDFMIPEVNIRKFLRPALQAKLCHIRGLCFMQLIGVHLKAGKFSEDRILQIQKLAENLRQQEDPLPTVILGDWNSYRKDRSGLEKDDIEFFEDILSTDFQPMRSIGKGITTYGTGEWAKDYDHIVISQQLDFYAVEAYPACSDGAPGDYIPYSSFNKYFSDHCPITAQLYVRPPVDSEFHSGDTQVFVR